MRGIRIAMWSGPRNISTAMMRSWENRLDTQVWDEPLYPYWLATTGTLHPGREEVLAAHKADLDAGDLQRRLASSPRGASIFYQKHMAHHLCDALLGDWMMHCRHALLVRRPDRVLSSLAVRYPEAGLEDTGLPQQVALLSQLDAMGLPSPPVVDADDVLAAPEQMLRALCDVLQVPWDQAMQSWPAGRRASDGAWAPWWYDRVEASTGFGPPRTDDPQVPAPQQSILGACQELYDQLCEFRIQP